jgi:transcription antitermination factor NusG
MARKIKIRGGKTPRVKVPYWCIVRVPIGKERFARQNVERDGGRVFYPRVQQPGRMVLTPLLPGYFFVLIDGDWGYLRTCPGIIQILTNQSGRPSKMDPEAMEALIAAQGDEGYIDLSPPIYEPKEGEQIKVMSGLFKDHLARYVGLTAENRVRAIIDFLGKPQELTLRKREIGKAD